RPIPGFVQLRLSVSAFQDLPGLQIDSVDVIPGSRYRADFDGTTLGPGWLTNSWASAGGGSLSAALAQRLLTLSGWPVRSVQTFSNEIVQGRVAFAASPWQHFGMATDLSAASDNDWAIFSTADSSDHLYARVNANRQIEEVDLGSLPRGFHAYRIDPTATG